MRVRVAKDTQSMDAQPALADGHDVPRLHAVLGQLQQLRQVALGVAAGLELRSARRMHSCPHEYF